jgi:hypothetical protein
MQSKRPVTLPKLISYVLSFSQEEKDKNKNTNNLENLFSLQIKSNDEFKFNCLKFGESKNINDFPKKLKSIFDPYIKDFIRYGSKKSLDQNSESNLSLYFSILKLLIPDFAKFTSKDQLNYIFKLRDKMTIYISTSYMLQENEYDKFGWIKKDMTTSLIQFKTNILIMKLIADYFSLNIFILNIIEDKIYYISDNDSFDLFRGNIFLVCNGDIFEPLIYNDKPILDYTDSVVNKLINVDANLLIFMNPSLKNQDNIKFDIKLFNINKYLKLIKLDDNIDDHFEEIIPLVDSDTIINNNTNLFFKISNKVKLSELQEIAKKNNISLEKNGLKKKLKTKAELIEDINKSHQK